MLFSIFDWLDKFSKYYFPHCDKKISPVLSFGDYSFPKYLYIPLHFSNLHAFFLVNLGQNNRQRGSTQRKRHALPGKYAHAKGVVAFDSNSGFWLIHSVPNFPDASATAYDFPGTVQQPGGRKYGQSFMCVEFDKTNDIAGPLALMKAEIYDQNVPTNWNLARYFPNVDQLLKKRMSEFNIVTFSLYIIYIIL